MEINRKIKRIFELTPVNGRQSFYGKCEVLQDENNRFYLKSYSTIVASYSDDDGIVHKYWGDKTMTTGSHIRAFLRNVCNDVIDIKQFYKLPLEEY